jgi:hypothetical protein
MACGRSRQAGSGWPERRRGLHQPGADSGVQGDLAGDRGFERPAADLLPAQVGFEDHAKDGQLQDDDAC